MERINQRIADLLEHFGMSASEFSRKIGVTSTSVVSRFLSGQTKPSFEVLENIIKSFPEIDANWLITGRGNMTTEKNLLPKNNDEKNWLLNFLKNQIEREIKRNDELQIECEKTKKLWRDLFDQLQDVKIQLSMLNQQPKKKETNQNATA